MCNENLINYHCKSYHKNEHDIFLFTIIVVKMLYNKHRNVTDTSAVRGATRDLKSYLPGTGESVISKADPPGRGPSIALRLG